MTNMFNDLVEDQSIEQEKDVLGGGFSVRESDVYEGLVKMVYAITSDGGAKGIHVEIELPDKSLHTEDIYLTSGTQKGGKNYYERDGKRHYLPGYLMAQALSLLTAKKEIKALAYENKTVEVWNKDAGRKIMTEVAAFPEMFNQPIKIGLLHTKQDRNEKNSQGKYVPTGEIREFNCIDKLFRARDNKTTEEIRNGAESTFMDKWLAKWKGQIDDYKAKGKRDPSLGAQTMQPNQQAAGSAFDADQGAGAGQAPASTQSLFD